MKSTNLISLINAKQILSSHSFNQYLNYLGVSIKDHEIEAIMSMAGQICGETVKLPDIANLQGFYVGFTINQISKQFDLLRIGTKSILNIELKQENTGEFMKEQLIQNRYYLSFLEKSVHNFTYVKNEEQLYRLNIKTKALDEAPFSDLINILQEQELDEVDDIQNLFDPSNYLVSPFNSTDKFILGQYFLTDHQGRIKNDILRKVPTSGPIFISIEGTAGTGKTLLTYDLAKEYMNQGKNVCVFHVGGLNSGHRKLINKGWRIAPIKDYKNFTFNIYDVIILDEVQRISKHQLEEILELIKNSNMLMIFSYDGEQCLSDWEINSKIPQFIHDQSPHFHHKLTTRIRTNKEISSFIRNLFNLSKRSPEQTYSNISIQFFKHPGSARNYTRILDNEGWKVINYTPSRFDSLPADFYSAPDFETAHNVIGQEFDQVAVIMDQHFYYVDGLLSTKGFKPYYHPTKMLFQILTRTRKKLHLIIINNEELLEKCLTILRVNK